MKYKATGLEAGGRGQRAGGRGQRAGGEEIETLCIWF